MTEDEKVTKDKEVTELELGTVKIEMKSEDGDVIKEVLAKRHIIELLMNDCYLINVEEKKLKDNLASKRTELKELLSSLTITKIISDDFTVSNIPSKRFSGWKDEGKVFELIPESLRGLETMVPDRKKIEALIKSKKIPEKVLKLMKFNNVKSIRFIPKGEEFTPATD